MMTVRVDREAMKDAAVLALREIYDPEIPVNIYDLGLVYGIEIDDSGGIAILMTLTSPMCPVAESLPREVETNLAAIPGVREVKVTLTWEPPWDYERMNEEAKLELGLF